MTVDVIDRPFIASLVTSLTGIPTTIDPVQPQAFVDPSVKARIFIDARALQPLGWDDFVREYDSGANKQVTTQDANRLFMLYVKAESFIPTLHAHDILEVLRKKLFRPSTLAQLRTKGMTATSAETTVDLPTTYDARVISAAALDVHMAFRYHEVDDTDDGVWIETFDLDYDPNA